MAEKLRTDFATSLFSKIIQLTGKSTVEGMDK